MILLLQEHVLHLPYVFHDANLHEKYEMSAESHEAEMTHCGIRGVYIFPHNTIENKTACACW